MASIHMSSGLEIYCNIESGRPDGNGMCMADARTGEIIWGAKYPTSHVHGTSFCSDIDRTQQGRECYGVEISPFEGKRTDFSVMYSSTILANTRHNCLLQDPICRNYVAHASTGYYELPMTTYDIPFRSSR